jgi:hypothetical protein
MHDNKGTGNPSFPVIIKEYAIDSDTYILANHSDRNFSGEELLLMGSGADITGGARPILKAQLSNTDKWGIESSDVVLGATLKLTADSVGGSADPGDVVDPGENDEIVTGTSDVQFKLSVDFPGDVTDPDEGDPPGDYDVLVSPTEPVMPGKLITVDLETYLDYVAEAATRNMVLGDVVKADYPAAIYPHRPVHLPTVDSATWNDYVGGIYAWETAGGSGVDLDIDRGISNDLGEFVLKAEFESVYELNVTNIVKDAIDNNSSDFSVELFRALDETGDNNENLTRFYGASHPLESLRPTLRITYIDRTKA